MKKLILVMLLFPYVLSAQILKPVKWSYAAKKTASNEALLYIKATIDPGWHIYSLNQKEGGPQKTSFTFTPANGYSLMGNATEPKPFTRFEEVFGMEVSFVNKTVVFQQKVRMKAKQTIIKGKVQFMACTDKKCLPPEEVAFSIKVQ